MLRGVRLGTVLALSLSLLVLLAAPALAAPKKSLEIQGIERTGAELRFTVLTPGGPLLEEDAFGVTVNGLPAEYVTAAAKTNDGRPSGGVLLVDSSGSMQGEAIRQARQAVGLFVSSVEENASLALMTFSDEVRLLQDYTAAHADVIGKIPSLRADGETALHDGLWSAVLIAKSRPLEQRNVILLTDGADTVSTTRFDAVLSAAQEARVRVFVVGLQSPDYTARSIAPLARRTGGDLLETTEAQELKTLFETVARTLASRYEVIITNPDAGATYLSVRVDVDYAGSRAVGTKVIDFDPASAPPEVEPLPDQSQLFVLVFGLVFAFVSFFAFMLFDRIRQKRISPSERIDWYTEQDPDNVTREQLVASAVLERAQSAAADLAERAGILKRLQDEIQAAGMSWRAGELIVASIAASLGGLVLGVLFVGPVQGIFLGVAGAIGPVTVAKSKASGRRKAFTQQLPDVLLLLSGALRAGHSIQQALAAVAKDAKPPASEEFKRVVAEIRLGASLDDALVAMSRRLNILDFEWTVLAIQIQREVGGNLAEILEIISETIRQRERLHGQIKALTAEGRISAWVLCGLPLGMGLILKLRNPTYLDPLFQTTQGLVMIGFSAVMMSIGVIWMRKIINIKV